MLLLQVAELVERLRDVKAGTERLVSALFNGKRINILGDINSAIASAGLTA
jgi:hypothetical protein